MGNLKLPKLPNRIPVRLTVNVAPDLHLALLDYGRLYAETYGREESIAELVPAILAAFLESDRAFSRRRKANST